MSIAQTCTVLVIGGGPGGSYTAAALAREGIDTVLLEAAVFPRYHIGESMIASIRHLLRFIDLDETFDQYGFTKKVGAAFRLNQRQREGFTDFIAAGGPAGYAWNVVRSESDDLMFQHARKCGAKVYDGIKIEEIHFTPISSTTNGSSEEISTASHRQPTSASWSSTRDETRGTISFEYVVDASGRAGVLNKYNKNRTFNKELNNVASWGYWQNTGKYALGTNRAGSPYFEALQDGSGWAWLIPLHNGTTSVGIVMKQELSTSKKRMMPDSASPKDFYLSSLKLAPNLSKLTEHGELVTDVKHASDFSYSSSSYASPYTRIVGDAGCFIDPYFSSGVHLALVSGLSAATTISAAIKGDCEEDVAANWHSTKVADGYARFLLMVLSAYRQIRSQDEDVLSEAGADNIDEAFALFRPIIQGLADSTSIISQAELSRTIDFCSKGFESVDVEERAAVVHKLDYSIAAETDDTAGPTPANQGQTTVTQRMKDSLSPEHKRAIDSIRARRLMRTEDTMHIDSFTTDVIDGMAPNLVRGNLTLVKAVPKTNGATAEMKLTTG